MWRRLRGKEALRRGKTPRRLWLGLERLLGFRVELGECKSIVLDEGTMQKLDSCM